MKKLFFAALLTAAVAGSAFAAETNKVNSAILRSFKSEFKQALNVTWKTDNYYTKASFTLNNKPVEAFYNLDGEIIGKSQIVSMEELPLAAKRSFAKSFGTYAVKQVIRFEGATENAYYISADSEKETIIVKADDSSRMSIFERTKK